LFSVHKIFSSFPHHMVYSCFSFMPYLKIYLQRVSFTEHHHNIAFLLCIVALLIFVIAHITICMHLSFACCCFFVHYPNESLMRKTGDKNLPFSPLLPRYSLTHTPFDLFTIFVHTSTLSALTHNNQYLLLFSEGHFQADSAQLELHTPKYRKLKDGNLYSLSL
jgi:hypothetical protein